MFSKYYQDQFINIYEEVLKPEKIVSYLLGAQVVARATSPSLKICLPIKPFFLAQIFKPSLFTSILLQSGAFLVLSLYSEHSFRQLSVKTQ